MDVNAPPPPTPRAAATVPPLPDPGGTTPAGPSQPHGLRGGLTPRRSPAPSDRSSSNSNRSSQTATGSDGSQADLPDDASRRHAGTNVDAPPPPNPGAAATVPPRPDPGGTTPAGPSQPHGSRGGLTPRRSPAPSDRSSSNSNWSGQRAGGSDASRPGVTNDVLNRRVVTNVNAPPPPTPRPAATVPPLPDPGGTVPARPSEPPGPRGGLTPRRTAAPTDRSTSNSNRSGQGAAGSDASRADIPDDAASQRTDGRPRSSHPSRGGQSTTNDAASQRTDGRLRSSHPSRGGQSTTNDAASQRTDGRSRSSHSSRGGQSTSDDAVRNARHPIRQYAAGQGTTGRSHALPLPVSGPSPGRPAAEVPNPPRSDAGRISRTSRRNTGSASVQRSDVLGNRAHHRVGEAASGGARRSNASRTSTRSSTHSLSATVALARSEHAASLRELERERRRREVERRAEQTLAALRAAEAADGLPPPEGSLSSAGLPDHGSASRNRRSRTVDSVFSTPRRSRSQSPGSHPYENDRIPRRSRSQSPGSRVFGDDPDWDEFLENDNLFDGVNVGDEVPEQTVPRRGRGPSLPPEPTVGYREPPNVRRT